MNELHHFDPVKSIQMEKIKNHNNTIETKYLDHELNKFKKEISMTRSRLVVVHDNMEHNSLTYKPLDNSNLISSFSHGHECVEDFYRESKNTTLLEKQIFENFTDPADDVNMIDKDIDFIDHLLDTEEMMKIDERYVHFGDHIEIINYDEAETMNSGKCSNDQLDNLNDDIQIEPVLEVNIVPKEQAHIRPKLELIGKPMQQYVDIATTKQDDNSHNLIERLCCSEEQQHTEQNPFVITRLDVASQPKPITNQHNVDTEFQVPPEQNAIVKDLFTNDIHSDTMRRNILQNVFLRWIHFTTIEKLAKDNITCNQSRIQKIEAFLNNIRLEKKKQIRNDSRIVDVRKKITETENPAVLARKYHHK